MHKQAVHIQSLIQENSRLNIKMLLENAEKMNLGSDFGKLDYNYTNGSNFATICLPIYLPSKFVRKSSLQNP